MSKHILLLITTLLLVQAAHAGVIGVSPGTVSIGDVLKEGYAEENLYISSSSENNAEGIVQIKGDLASWVQVKDNLTKFNVSRDFPHVITLVVMPPQDLATGNYSGKIIVSYTEIDPISGRAGGVVLPGISIDAAVEVVGHQKLACRAGGYSIPDTEIGFPLEVKAVISNDGNVRISPNATMEIWDSSQEQLITTYSFQYSELLPTITQQKIERLTNNLERGQYWARIRIPQCNSESLETFDVLQKGELADRGEFLELRYKHWAIENETILIAALFRNTGERTVSAQFTGFIFNEGRIVEKLLSDEVDLQPGETATLLTEFEPPAPAVYTISGRVKYNKKITAEKQGVLNVTPGIRKSSASLPLFIIYIILAMTIIFLLRLIIQRRKKSEN